jgi:hypothetical protein
VGIDSSVVTDNMIAIAHRPIQGRGRSPVGTVARCRSHAIDGNLARPPRQRTAIVSIIARRGRPMRRAERETSGLILRKTRARHQQMANGPVAKSAPPGAGIARDE